MRFAGIDIGAERHAVAMVDEAGNILHKPESVGEEAAGYRRLRALLGDPSDCLVAMEATGHYWKNLFSWLTAEGFSIALINPITDATLCGGRTATHQDRSCRCPWNRTLRSAEASPTHTPIGPMRPGAACSCPFACAHDPASRRPRARSSSSDRSDISRVYPARSRSRHGTGDRHTVSLSHRARNSHRNERTLAAICFDGRRRVGHLLARTLISAAQTSVGQHQTEPYERQVRYACQDILAMRARARELESEIQHRLEGDEVGNLLTTIPGISTLTAAAIIAEAGNPARFRDAAAFASYVGVIPRLHQSGKRNFSGKSTVPLGNSRLQASALDACLSCDSSQSMVERLLSAAPCRWQTAEGRDDRLHAQTFNSSL